MDKTVFERELRQLELPTVVRVLANDHVAVNQIAKQFIMGDILTVQECLSRIIFLLCEQNKNYEDRLLKFVSENGLQSLVVPIHPSAAQKRD